MPAVDFNVLEYERELKRLGVPVSELCRRAGINHSTWNRWKREDFEPRRQTERKILAAMEEIRAVARVPREALRQADAS